MRNGKFVSLQAEIDRRKVNNCRQQVKLGALKIFHFAFVDTQKK